MCERARRHLEPTLPSRVKGPSPGGPKFFTTGNIAFPSLAGLVNTVGLVMGFTVRFLCAGLKAASQGPEQLVRFWDIRVVAIGIIQRSHDPGPLLSPTDPNCRVRPGSCKTQKARETGGGPILPWAMEACWSP